MEFTKQNHSKSYIALICYFQPKQWQKKRGVIEMEAKQRYQMQQHPTQKLQKQNRLMCLWIMFAFGWVAKTNQSHSTGRKFECVVYVHSPIHPHATQAHTHTRITLLPVKWRFGFHLRNDFVSHTFGLTC